jgi:UMF1 family MFS transporter
MITFLSLGSLADYGGMRKSLMLVFAVAGAATCFVVVMCTADHLYWMTTLMLILGSVFMGASLIFHNAYVGIHVDTLYGGGGSRRL